MTTTAPSPAVSFWRRKFNGERGYIYLFSGVRTSPQTKTLADVHKTMFPYPQAVGNAEQWLIDESNKGREVYAGAALFVDRKRGGTQANVGTVRTAWVDGDGCTVPDHIPQPTITIQTSPGRWNYEWILTKAITRQEAEELNRRLAYALGADKGGWDANQLLRVPGLPNRKYPHAPVVTIISDDGPTYDPDELKAALPPAPAENAHQRSTPDGESTGVGEAEPWWPGMDAARWRGEKPAKDQHGGVDNSGTLWAIGCEADELGAPESLVEAILKNRDQALNINKYTSRPDMYRQQAEKIADPNRERPKRVTVALAKDEEPSPCGDQVVAMQARIDQLEAANAELTGRLQRIYGIVGHPDIGNASAKIVLIAGLKDLAAAPATPEEREGGYRVIWRDRLREQTGGIKIGVDKRGRPKYEGGVSQAIASKAVHDYGSMFGWSVENEDRESDGVPEIRVSTPHLGNFDALASDIVTWRRPEEEPRPARPGGNRRQCPDHPNARLVKRTTWTCMECGQIIDEDTTVEHPASIMESGVSPSTEGDSRTCVQNGSAGSTASSDSIMEAGPPEPGSVDRPRKDIPDDAGLRECVICRHLGRYDICPAHDPLPEWMDTSESEPFVPGACPGCGGPGSPRADGRCYGCLLGEAAP